MEVECIFCGSKYTSDIYEGGMCPNCGATSDFKDAYFPEKPERKEYNPYKGLI